MRGGPLFLATFLATHGAGAMLQPAPGPGAELPPIQCVEALRTARIERQQLDGPAAAQRLERALELPGCELPALAELIRLAGEGMLPDSRDAELRRRLAARLEDPGFALPDGIVEYLATLSGEERDGRLLLDSLGRRLERLDASEVGPDRRQLTEMLRVSARLQQELGQLREALDTIDRLATLDDSESWRWEGLNLAYRLEDWPQVAHRVESMLELPGAAEQLRPLYVQALAQLGRFEELEVQLDLLSPRVVASTGEPLEVVGDESEEEWQREAYARLLRSVAWALRDAGRDAEAEAVFRRVLSVAPEDASVRLVLLHLYGSQEERAGHAAAVAERRRGETDPQSLYEEGSQLLAAGDAASALDLLERAAPGLNGTPVAEAAWYNLGLAAYKLERWEQAAEAFAQASDLNPDRPETHSQRGLALARLDRCEEAAPELERYLSARPDKHEVRYYLARCYEALGRGADAEREWALYRSWKNGR